MNQPSLSPDLRYELRFSSFEVRMSHWIEQPYLVRLSDQRSLFTLHDLWSLDEARWSSPVTLTMQLRLYPGLLSCVLTLDVEANQGLAQASDGRVYSGTLVHVAGWVNALDKPKWSFFRLGWFKLSRWTGFSQR